MDIDIRHIGKYVIIDIFENIDLTNVGEYRKLLFDLLEKDTQNLVLNLQNTHYIDSSGIGMLITFAKKFNAMKYELGLLNLDERMKNYFNVAGLSDFFTVYESENELK